MSVPQLFRQQSPPSNPHSAVGQHNAYKLENTINFTISADIFVGMNKAYIDIFP